MHSIPSRAVSVLLIALISAVCLIAQTSPLAKFRFEDGGYKFVGIFAHHDDHPLQKQLGEFYTDDVAVLNDLKRSWRFRRPQKDYACGYHYQFLILRNGIIQDSFVVNLECNQLRTDDRSLYFDLKKLSAFAGRFKPLRREEKEFASISEARAYLESARSASDFMYVQTPKWSEFEGKFSFNYRCPDRTPICYTEFPKYKSTLENEISSKYPGEKFSLRANGGSSNGEVFVEVESNKSLAERFDLYDRWGRKHFGGWEAYTPYLVIYFADKSASRK
jgi:hypothetical protein